jgi:phosphonate transport system ATP-binding protein
MARSVLTHSADFACDRMIALLVSLHQVELAIKYADRVIGLRGRRMMADWPAAAFAETDQRRLFGARHFQKTADNGQYR